ncbi:MAG: nicotinate-nucleotide--dimethylbenzimidazole phosphoribosyltransferase [Desulfovibrionaceae bacterium]|nr:nicotinate-nucleotide--dimethylbenzimidazole phosphoribosyltransferase [Desulfovibrionaceae bacterium]MBF0513953.1 nicotinate-nucleotide--dimethylbenzimidazole phosphoribosyltransferase [Desulfovibrionaceae bacterium]
MRSKLFEVIDAIEPVDRGLAAPGQARLDDLTKPRGSLGRLESLALQLYMIQGGGAPAAYPARIYTCAGDHGVAAEGVSLFPQEVTRQMVHNFMSGGAAINALAGAAGVDLKVVDAGCLGDDFAEHPNLIRGKIGRGAANIAAGPAMSEDDCVRALLLGVSLAGQARAEGYRSLGTGDMGIANTTPSTALYCAYLGLSPLEIAGPGTGLAPEAVKAKAAVIERALAANREAVAGGDALNALAALGGYEIACLAGLTLGAAANKMAVAVDGFISTAAYVAAWKMCPAVADYAVFAHASAEPGHAKVLAALGIKPLFDLEMRLGEGTGAALALFTLKCAAAVFNEMATFSSAGVSGESA